MPKPGVMHTVGGNDRRARRRASDGRARDSHVGHEIDALKPRVDRRRECYGASRVRRARRSSAALQAQTSRARCGCGPPLSTTRAEGEAGVEIRGVDYGSKLYSSPRSPSSSK